MLIRNEEYDGACSRRSFLAASFLSMFLPLHPSFAENLPKHREEKLKVAIVGCGTQGVRDFWDLEAIKEVDVVGLCDVDSEASGVGDFPIGGKVWTDYRKMLNNLRDHLQAVVVAVPDHMHASIIRDCLNSGLHVFCHAPLCWSIQEYSQIIELCGEKKRCTTQLGLEYLDCPNKQYVIGVIKSNALGKINRVYCWTSIVDWEQATPKSKRKDDIPNSLDWDLWIGVAPYRHYVEDIYTPYAWRGIKDFGLGTVGSIASNLLDFLFLLEDDFIVKSVVCDSTIGPTGDKYGNDQEITIDFKENMYTTLGGMTVHWMDGTVMPNLKDLNVPPGTDLPESGCALVFEKGTLIFNNFGNIDIIKDGVLNRIDTSDQKRSYRYSLRNWIDSSLNKKQADYNFVKTQYLNEFILVVNIASRVPRDNLHWDTLRKKFKDHDQANAHLAREERLF